MVTPDSPTITVDIADDLVTLPVDGFFQRLAKALPPLIRFTLGPTLREHPKWGRRLPFSVPGYGAFASPGHVCRPDVLLTSQGPRICELDFVPSGRGWVLAGLVSDADRIAFLREFAHWYESMGSTRVYYATGTVTECREEVDLFSGALRDMLGFDITSINIDVDTPAPHGLVDRLFYRSELEHPLRTGGHRVVTAEPWLDSKMIFAVLHDASLTAVLEESIGAENLAFLRKACIESYLFDDVRSALESGALVPGDRSAWVLKATDVEERQCWGSRGVVLGRQRSDREWSALLRGEGPDREALGRWPILQRFERSSDFSALWNAGVEGKVPVAAPERLGKRPSPVTRRPASGRVNGRLGTYFLVSHESDRIFVPPLGPLCLRQHPLTHGTADSVTMSFRARGECARVLRAGLRS
ncbi:hypothetical protein J2Z21_008352 [Streptomyces griseochromogenes]|uniref:Uncharacterized protein n=1 Tax=Streptomyces griseochromogenes TaxID=68214 RepID=A0A1B1B0Z8_9ACTN|nr:hypothetical protein [Streptomyces griseochromogenes]ANP52421.1 hypothetical protein AVL59_25370 [Streptomyces griseochromogenes]MBP2055338.1 hypothetical protein [Streptomyces griseochromogenes]